MSAPLDDQLDVVDLKSLRCLWALGRRGSISGASIELGISEPAVSKRLRKLADYLGVALYDAPGGKVTLTEEGTRTWEMSVSLFDQLSEFEANLRDGGVSGDLTIVAEDPVQRYLLVPLFADYRRQHPAVRIRLPARKVSEALGCVARAEADLAVVPKRAVIPAGLMFWPWRTYEAHLIAAAGHPIARDGKIDLARAVASKQIERYELVVAESQELDAQRVTSTMRDHGVAMSVALAVGSIDGVKEAVAAGLGLGVVPAICLDPADGRLVATRLPNKYQAQTVYGAIFRESGHRSAAMAALLELMTS